jgi:hypothetical protein
MRGFGAAALIWGAVLITGPALAQDTSPAPAPAPAGRTGTGDVPQRTGAITGLGQTKPPGTALGDTLGTRPDLQEKSRQLDRRIHQGICSGCR